MHAQQEQAPNARSITLLRGCHGHLARLTCRAYAQEDENIDPLLGVIAGHQQGLRAISPAVCLLQGLRDCHGKTTSLYGLYCRLKDSPALLCRQRCG